MEERRDNTELSALQKVNDNLRQVSPNTKIPFFDENDSDSELSDHRPRTPSGNFISSRVQDIRKYYSPDRSVLSKKRTR